MGSSWEGYVVILEKEAVDSSCRMTVEKGEEIQDYLIDWMGWVRGK